MNTNSIKADGARRGLAAIGCAGTLVVLGTAGCAAASAHPAAAGLAISSTTSAAAKPPSTQAPSASPTSHATSAPANTPAPQNSPSPAAANAPARCHTGDLSGSFTVVANSEGMGNIVYNIKLTNTSGHTCTVYGYPGLLLQDAQHASLPTKALWDSLVPVRLITVSPGNSASASVRFSPDIAGPGDPGTSPCEPTSYYIEITPPNETTHLLVPVERPTPVCERGTLQVSAFVAGPVGPGA